ncbi:MAG: substrate-binding domain-containing protein [Tepidisphaeraceae bacterium]
MPATARPIRVGVIVNNVGGYSRGVIRGITSFAYARAWTCRVQGVNDESIDKRLDEFDGLIVQTATPQQSKAMAALNIAIVNVSSKLELQQFPSVVSDDVAVGRLGADHFLQRGHHRLVYFAPEDRQYARLRHAGFHQRVRETRNATEERVTTERELTRVIEQREDRLAIMACNDRAALVVLERCRAMKVRVPDEVAVLGVDNDDLVQSLAYPPMSTINTARERIGFEAASMLERLISGQALPARSVLIPPQSVIVRRSTDVLALDDTEVADAVRYIHAHAGRPIGVNDVLREVPLSRRQLERRFRIALGRSILDEISRCRIERAKQLLVDTELTLPQVALASGFRSASYFSVVFGKLAGTTPGSFRGQLPHS